ncbi:MAG: hypothetical protein RSA06_07120 [Erysipelotrichaceae bacterium]
MENLSSLLGELAGFLIVILLVALAIYIVSAIFLNKFNKLVYGKGTAMAWIPILDIYLLGKLTVNKWVGWVLVICVFLKDTYTTTVNGVESTRGILPEGIRNVVSTIYGLAVLGLFIYAIIKYNKLKKEKAIGTSQQNVNQQPIQNMNNVPSNMDNGISMQPTTNSVSSVQEAPAVTEQPQSISVDQSIQNVQTSQVQQQSIQNVQSSQVQQQSTQNETLTMNDVNMNQPTQSIQQPQPTVEQPQNPINTNINNNNGF